MYVTVNLDGGDFNVKLLYVMENLEIMHVPKMENVWIQILVYVIQTISEAIAPNHLCHQQQKFP
jgi:hypothetical protein